MVFESGMVTRYDKGAAPSPEMVYIDYGLSVLTRAVVSRLVPPAAVADLAAVYHQLSVDGQLAGFEARRRFYEVGSEEGLQALTEYLMESCGPASSRPSRPGPPAG